MVLPSAEEMVLKGFRGNSMNIKMEAWLTISNKTTSKPTFVELAKGRKPFLTS